jgi:two-component system, OmpR family, KDP operon response regulator KdpE
MTPPDTPVVLVVEDEPAPLRVVEASLAARGFRVLTATTGARALELVSEEPPDVMVVDLGLPDMDGLVLCRHLRLWTKSPIIVVTADGSEERMVQALDEGADDYVTKPFSMPELLARVRVASRHRSTLPSLSEQPVIVVGALSIDVEAQQARVGERLLDLEPKQLKLLTLLARNAGRLLTYGQVTLQLWGPVAQGSVAHELRLLVSSLRASLGDGPGLPKISAEQLVGYRMVGPDHLD